MKDIFEQLVAEANTEFLRDNAPVTEDLDAVEEITSHLQWICINVDEGDEDTAKLENLAAAVAAAHRYAAELLKRISLPSMQAMLQRNAAMSANLQSPISNLKS